MKCHQEEKAESREYQKTGMEVDCEHSHQLITVTELHNLASLCTLHRASLAAPHQQAVRKEAPSVKAHMGFHILRLRSRRAQHSHVVCELAPTGLRYKTVPHTLAQAVFNPTHSAAGMQMI